MGTKGARLTTEISLPGRFLVYTPYGDGIGVSRRLEDDERERLKEICKGLELPEGGLIVRTAAEGASEQEFAGDLKLLLKLWSTIRGRAERAQAPTLVYQEAELPLRIVRDLFIRDFKRVVVDHERTFRKIVAYLKRTSPELAARVERYKGKEPLLEKSGVLEAVNSTLSRRVDLPSGGYLVFDYAEAFTVIDVNTGRFVGGRGKSSNARLEDTITKNNLEAVTEVVRQLRLRDIGGIIVIDFIDMANPKNRQLVEDALDTELARDRTKTYVVEISPLGLVEMTRQNVTDGPREILTDTCPTCDATGVVVSAETRAVEVERKLRKHVAGLEGRGVPRRAPLRRRGHPDRPERRAPRGAGEGDRQALRVQDEEVLPARPLRRSRRRARPRRSRACPRRQAAREARPQGGARGRRGAGRDPARGRRGAPRSRARTATSRPRSPRRRRGAGRAAAGAARRRPPSPHGACGAEAAERSRAPVEAVAGRPRSRARTATPRPRRSRRRRPGVGRAAAAAGRRSRPARRSVEPIATAEDAG